MLIGLLSSKSEKPSFLIRGEDSTAAGSTNTFLNSKLKYHVDKHGQEICSVLAGEDEIGVMMGWERPIMQKSVEVLCSDHPEQNNLKVLNIGFGLGIVRTFNFLLVVSIAYSI
jgi:type IV protein arginine methyltransferase